MIKTIQNAFLKGRSFQINVVEILKDDNMFSEVNHRVLANEFEIVPHNTQICNTQIQWRRRELRVLGEEEV